MRYLGASNTAAWQFTKALYLADAHGWARFISMQNHYNLVYREEEREMNPYCAKSGVGLTPWSPLARGILAGSYRGGFERGSTDRSKGGDRMRTQSLYTGARTFEIADRVVKLAEKYGRTPAQISLAWLLGKPEVHAPVVGVSRVEQLEQLVAATEISLDAADVAHLEELYQPVPNLLSLGFS